MRLHLPIFFGIFLFPLGVFASYSAHTIEATERHLPFVFQALYVMGGARDSVNLVCPDGVKLEKRVFTPGDFNLVFTGSLGNGTSLNYENWLCARIATKSDSEHVTQVNPRGLTLDSISNAFEYYEGYDTIPYPFIQHVMDLDFSKNRTPYSHTSSSNYVIWPITDSVWVQACISKAFRMECKFPKMKKLDTSWRVGRVKKCRLLDPLNENPEENVSYRIGTGVTWNYNMNYRQSDETWLDSNFYEMPTLELMQVEADEVLIHYKWHKGEHTYDYLISYNKKGQRGWKALYNSFWNSDKDCQTHTMGIKDGLFRVNSKVATPDGFVRNIKVKWDGGPKADY